MYFLYKELKVIKLVSDCCLICQLRHGENKLMFHEMIRFVLDQHAELDLYSASSLKQQSADRHVSSFGHIILISIQPVFALTP